MFKQNKNIILGGIILLLALVAAYANHFNNGFHFDDSHTVQDNVYIRNLKNIPGFFTDPRMFSANPMHWSLRPLVTLSLAIDYWLGGGLNPFYFQLSTFVWYTLLCVCLFFVYRKILLTAVPQQWPAYLALFATGWFSLHTANAETVNYIIARSDVLSTFFIVASLLIYIALPSQQKWYWYIIPAFIGVFAKETVLVLVVILFFYIILFEKKLSLYDVFKTANLKHVFSAILKLLPLLIVVLATQLYLVSKNPPTNGVSNPLGYYVLTQSFVWVRYFIAFFLPMNLTADSDWTVITNITDERIIVGLLFVVALFIAIFKTSAKAQTKPIAFGLIWFAAALLPTSLVPLSEVTNDHRMFFAFIGLTLSVVSALGLWFLDRRALARSNSYYPGAMVACVLIILSLNAYGVYQRNKVWKNEESLWLDVTNKSPMNGRGLMNYGLTQMQKGNYAAADSYFNRALVYLPRYNTLYINLGVLNGALNRPEQADDYFKKAIALSPNTDDSYMFYARYLRQNNRLPQAQQMAERAYRINPSGLMTLGILMDVYNLQGLWDKLEAVAKQMLSLLPTDRQALTYLAAAKNRTPLAGTPSSPGNNVANHKQFTAADYLGLSLTYYNAKLYDKCIEACMQAIKLKPDYADAYSNMGAAYNMQQQWDKGIDACKKALQFNPKHVLALGNLNWARAGKKKLEK